MLKSILAVPVFIAACCLLPFNACAALKIGLLPASDTLALHVAKDEGLFEKHGLDVELIPFQSALEQGAAVRSGAIQGWFTDIIAMMIMHESGAPQQIIATMAYSEPGNRFFGIAVAPGSAISDVEGLKGAKIAISQATIIEYMLDGMLASKGQARSFVDRIDIKQISVRLQLLLAGKCDAALLPEPLLSLVEAKGARVIMDDTGLNEPLAITSLRQGVCGPEEVKAFQAALAEAMKKINAEPDRYREVMIAKKLLPKAASEKYSMLRFDPARTPTPLPSREELEQVARWMLENKLLRKMPGAWDMISDS